MSARHLPSTSSIVRIPADGVFHSLVCSANGSAARLESALGLQCKICERDSRWLSTRATRRGRFFCFLAENSTSVLSQYSKRVHANGPSRGALAGIGQFLSASLLARAVWTRTIFGSLLACFVGAVNRLSCGAASERESASSGALIKGAEREDAAGYFHMVACNVERNAW